MLRFFLSRVLLISMLLFAQLGSLAHGISHTLSGLNPGSDQSLPHGEHCDLCAVYAQIGSAIGSNSMGLTDSASIKTTYVDYSETAFFLPFLAFTARAPPRSF